MAKDVFIPKNRRNNSSQLQTLLYSDYEQFFFYGLKRPIVQQGPMMMMMMTMMSKFKARLSWPTGCMHCLFMIEDIPMTNGPRLSLLKATTNFIKTSLRHIQYFCNRNTMPGEVDSVDSVWQPWPADQPMDDSPVNAAANLQGYMLLIPGKR